MPGSIEGNSHDRGKRCRPQLLTMGRKDHDHGLVRRPTSTTLTPQAASQTQLPARRSSLMLDRFEVDVVDYCSALVDPDGQTYEVALTVDGVHSPGRVCRHGAAGRRA